MTDMLTPAQQTTLIILALLAAGAFVLALVARALRRWLGARQIRSSSAAEDAPALPAPWRKLRDDATLNNHILNRDIFERARQVFLDYYAPGGDTPAALTREYLQEEFLLVVNEDGQPGKAFNKEMLDHFRKTVASHPAFGRWFQEDLLSEGEFAGTPVLLAARWLCHLIGLRHGTVQILIDPPGAAGHTLVQVRGMDKFDAPGAFDIPCAGHISGVTPPLEALGKELGEELALRLDQLEDLRLLGRYNSFTGENQPGGSARFANHEHAVLYRARLKAEVFESIRFADGEVAGISMFSVTELRAFVRAYPERVAGGLRDALGFYD